MNYRKANQIAKEAQERINRFTDRVNVTFIKDDDGPGYILIGTYTDHDGPNQMWTEHLDRYSTDCDLFVSYFKRRKDWLNAPYEVQDVVRSNNIHPQDFDLGMITNPEYYY
jgi:hypothetical protein